MRKISTRALWVGHAGDLRDVQAVMATGIEAVIELSDSEQSAVLPRELIRGRFPLSDGGDNPVWLIRLATNALAALMRAGVPTLICCSAGMSRSLCIASSGIALTEGLALTDALTEVIGSGPVDVSPALWNQVRLIFDHQPRTAPFDGETTEWVPLEAQEKGAPETVASPARFGILERITLAVVALILGTIAGWMFWIVHTFLTGRGWFDLIVGTVLDALILALAAFSTVLLIRAVCHPAWLDRISQTVYHSLRWAIGGVGLLVGAGLAVLIVLAILVQLGMVK